MPEGTGTSRLPGQGKNGLLAPHSETKHDDATQYGKHREDV